MRRGCNGSQNVRQPFAAAVLIGWFGAIERIGRIRLIERIAVIGLFGWIGQIGQIGEIGQIGNSIAIRLTPLVQNPARCTCTARMHIPVGMCAFSCKCAMSVVRFRVISCRNRVISCRPCNTYSRPFRAFRADRADHTLTTISELSIDT